MDFRFGIKSLVYKTCEYQTYRHTRRRVQRFLNGVIVF